MTGPQPAEPDLAQVAAQFPGWQCWPGPGRLCYARHTTTGTQARGEDPLDLRDQISAAERMRAYEQDAAGRAPHARQ